MDKKKLMCTAMAACMALSCAAGTAGAVDLGKPATTMGVSAAKDEIEPYVLWINRDEYSGMSYSRSFATNSDNGATLALYFENLYADSTALNVNLTWTSDDGTKTENWDYEVKAGSKDPKTFTLSKTWGIYKLYVTPLSNGERMHFFVHSRQY